MLVSSLSLLSLSVCSSRSLSEFWHWMVSNVPGDDLDRGDVVLDLLHPLVLPDGDGDHRFGYFVLRQPGRVDFSREGGPTPSCAVDMSAGRGPYRSGTTDRACACSLLAETIGLPTSTTVYLI